MRIEDFLCFLFILGYGGEERMEDELEVKWNEENNGERHLKYQVTVNKDLSVSYEGIN